MEGKRILVSRNLEVGAPLRSWANKLHHQLIESPFIRIEPVLDVDIPPTDWIFFSSPNSVDAYFDHYPLLARQVGAYGEGTQYRLTLREMKADFVGDTSKNSAQIGRDFFAVVPSESSVFFPQSQIAGKRVIPEDRRQQCVEKVIYHTLTTTYKVQGVDVAILTSPSNIDGFLLENNPEGIDFIVLGETSKNHFHSLGVTSRVYQSASASQTDVVQLLDQLLKQY